MITNSLSKGLIRRSAAKPRPRSTKPTLERLDTRIALSGISAAVAPARYVHMPLGNPTGIPFVVWAPPPASNSPGAPGHGPAQIVPDGWSLSR